MTNPTRRFVATILFAAAAITALNWFTPTGWVIAATLALAAVFLTPFE